jgi:hypothetical protein
MVTLVHAAYGGWNYGSRSNCHIFAKYRVEVHAGFTSSSGGDGGIARDTGCSYAHAGPLRYYTSQHVLLSEAEGYKGNSAFWGYAHAWDVYDPVSLLIKHGYAAEPAVSSRKGTSSAAINPVSAASEARQSASNHFSVEDVLFDEARESNKKSITLKNITTNLVAGVGYSLVEIIVWKPKDDVAGKVADVEITSEKIVWQGRALVHDNRLTTEGEFPDGFLAATPPASPGQMQKESVYAVYNKDLQINLPDSINLDEIEVFIRGDAGDESILHPERKSRSRRP